MSGGVSTRPKKDERGTGGPLDLLDFFTRLARDVGARSAWPLADGSILFVFREPAVLPDGSALFDQPIASAGGAALKWHPEAGGASRLVSGLPGGLSVQGLTARQTRLAASRLSKVAGGRRLGPLTPLARRPQEPNLESLSASLSSGCLGRFLQEEKVSWGRLRLGRVEAFAGGVRLPFSGGGQLVIIELRASPEPASSSWRDVPPLVMRLAFDDRAGGAALRPEEAVEEYVAYAVARSLETGAPPSCEPGPARPPCPAGSKGALPAFFDARDEVRQEAFFIPAKERVVGAMEALTTLLESDPAVAVVSFAHPTCLGKIPLLDRTDYARWMWHRFSPLPLKIDAKPCLTPDLPEADLVVGSEERFRLMIEKALARQETRVLALLSTCIPELIGMDVASIMEEECARKSAEPLVFQASLDDGSSVSRLWERLFSLGRRDAEPREGTVNLVGFAASEERVAGEMRADLGRLGLNVNGFFIPSFRHDEMRRFFEARCTFVNRTALSELEFRHVRGRFPEIDPIDIPPPFGLAGTRRFMRRVLSACGRPAAAEADVLEAPFLDDLERWRARAAEHEAAIILGPGDARYIHEPAEIYGLDLVGLLREMGFGVRIACRGAGKDEGCADEAAKLLRSSLYCRLGGDERVNIEAVSPNAPPSAIIGDMRASIVFTEYPPDLRVLDAGALSFHPRDFEMGFAGALRSLMCLVRKAESPLPSTFADSRTDRCA